MIDAGPESFSTELELRQLAGRARATLRGPWHWQGATLPALERRRVRVGLHAERFDLRAFDPLLPKEVRALGGRLDADLSLDPSLAEAIQGDARLREGRFYVDALGQEFRDVALDARLDASGRILVERHSARALRGRVSASGQVEMEGLALRSAELRVEIPKGDPLPLRFEGVTVASAWGRLDLTADGDLVAGGRGGTGEQPALTIAVAVPRLTILLPAEPPRDVQELADDPTITAGTYLPTKRFITLPLPPYDGAEGGPPTNEDRLIRFEIQLGNDVWVERLTAELAYRLEAPNPGGAQDRTHLTLDLRLFRNWSLSATIGDAGCFVLDLLWRYRY